MWDSGPHYVTEIRTEVAYCKDFPDVEPLEVLNDKADVKQCSLLLPWLLTQVIQPFDTVYRAKLLVNGLLPD